MSTFKVLLDKRRKLKNGSYPLVVRIYNGTKFRDMNLKAPLFESQFDESKQRVNNKHPNKKLLNQKIQKIVLQVQEATLNLEIKDEVLTAGSIKRSIVKPTAKLNFIEYGTTLVEQMKAVGRIGNAICYRDALTALKFYSGRTQLQFQDVNYELLCQVENKMLAAGLKRNSIAVYNRALSGYTNSFFFSGVCEQCSNYLKGYFLQILLWS